jgi:hypothetical protein
MLTVACVLKSGGIYNASWVARLRAGVAKHLPIPHRFVCMSDLVVPGEWILLQHNWPGWWSKLELFKLSGPVLYFDLDTAIVGDLTDIARHADVARFTMLRDFYAPKHFGSGVMAWGGDAPVHIYNEFAADPGKLMDAPRVRMGDQAFIENMVDDIDAWQDVTGDQVVSYKVHCRGGVPPNARVVCLHGFPKFADMPPGDPVRVAWEQ